MMLKSVKGYKTIIFNVVMGAVLIYNALVPDAPVPTQEEVGGIVDQVLDNLDALITVGGNLWLRFVTTSPVFTKP